MPRTHDGITCPLPISPVSALVGLAALGGGGWLAWTGSIALGAALCVVGALVLVNQVGSRRVRVIQTKLLVEDERLLVSLLIGPRRSRIGWDEVRGFRVDGGALVLETAGKPFVTAQGASREDLEALKASAEEAWRKARAATG